MKSLVTRFHLLLLTVTLAITGVGFFRIPADYTFPAHWAGSTPDWLWPRDVALGVAPVVQVLLLAAFYVLGRLLTKNQFSKSQHILDPALTLVMSVVAAVQFGLLFAGIGSDLDLVRFTGLGLGCVLILIGIVLFEAERHTYAGLRMPWPIKSDLGWRVVHRSTGMSCGLAGICLLALTWFDAGIGITVVSLVAALVMPVLVAVLATIPFIGR